MQTQRKSNTFNAFTEIPKLNYAVLKPKGKKGINNSHLKSLKLSKPFLTKDQLVTTFATKPELTSLPSRVQEAAPAPVAPTAAPAQDHQIVQDIIRHRRTRRPNKPSIRIKYDPNKSVSVEACKQISERFGWPKDKARKVLDVAGTRLSFAVCNDVFECRQVYDDTEGFLALRKGKLWVWLRDGKPLTSASYTTKEGIKAWIVKPNPKEMISFMAD